MDTIVSLKLPPKKYRRTIEELSVVIPDPALKLKFLKQAINEHQKISAPYKLYPPIAGIAFRKRLLNNAENICPGSKKAAKKLIRKGVISDPGNRWRWRYKLYYLLVSAILILFISRLGTAVLPSVRNFNFGTLINLSEQQAKTANEKIIIRKSIFYSQLPRSGDSPKSSIFKSANLQNGAGQVSWYFKNPVLTALTSQQTNNSKSEPISQKFLLSSQPQSSGYRLLLPVILSGKHQNEPELVLNYFKNPILTALTFKKTNKSQSGPISQKPLLSAQPQSNVNHLPFPAIKPTEHQSKLGLALNIVQNPMLLALTTQQTNNSKSEPISQKFLLSSQPQSSGYRPPLPVILSGKHQNEPELILNYLKNPILTALTSQKTNFPQSGSIYQKLLLSAQPTSSGNHPPISAVKSVKHRNEPELALNYFKNPILKALVTQPTNNLKPKPISKKRLVSSQSQSGENNLPVSTNKPEEQQNDLKQPLNYFRNPILSALTTLPTEKINRVSTFQKTTLSSQPQSIRSHLPLSTNKPAEYSNKPIQFVEYLKDPIILTLNSQRTHSSKSDHILSKPLLPSQTPGTENHSAPLVVKPAKKPDKIVQVPKYLKGPIWLVEKSADREFYSNRLQIITTYTISNIPREYYRFSRNSDYSPANSKVTNKISGIVYHASESDLYPFMPEMNSSILGYSKRLIKYLLRKKSYNFFIDRFGRVYRLVQEDHAAFHAGKSIWADDETLYLNLNHSFIGICFEGKDFQEINTGKQKKGRPANPKSSHLQSTGISSFNEAQLRSGKELTDWLRVKYNISQQNCVPHALISVNTKRMLIGFHLDLSRGFPFAILGLTDKYQEPLPSMVEFGFRYDKYFEKIFNGNLWRGIGYSEEILQRRARNLGMSFAKYRKSLQQRFTRYKEWNQKLAEKKDQLTKTFHKQ